MTTRLAVFDLDGTLTSKDTYKRFLRQRLRARPWRAVTCVTLPWHYHVAVSQRRDHVWLKLKALKAVVAGSSRAELASFAERFARDVVETDVSAAARDRIASHRAAGDNVVLCSASFDFYVEAIGAALGFDQVICTRSSWRNDRLVAAIDGENCFGDEKIRRLDAYVARLDSTARPTVTAYTDHHSDLPLLEWADVPVAISPTKPMRAIADERGFAVEMWHAQSAFQ
ncbi:MAG: HAD-IB family hydrolase [Pseudomonadota bacterium]